MSSAKKSAMRKPLQPIGRMRSIGLFFILMIAFSVWPSELPATEQKFEFTLPDLSGESHSLSQYKGKVVVIDIWAVWCITCRQVFPILNKIRRDFSQDRVAVLGISIDKKPIETVAKFARISRLEYTILHDKKNKTPLKFGIKAIPSLFVLDPGGSLVYSHFGPLKDQGKALVAIVHKILAETAPSTPMPEAGNLQETKKL